MLKVFDAVVRHGGFSAAQIELNVGMSTISNHITALEQRLGVSLCRRGRGGFKLTETGEVVHLEAQKLLATLDEFSARVGALKGQMVGTLRIGIVDATATDPNNLLHRAIESFLARPSAIRFEVRQCAPQDLQENLLRGQFDLAIGSFPHKAAGLVYTPLYRETHSLYCAAAHRLFAKPEAALSLKDLQRERAVGRGYWRDQHNAALGFDNIGAVVFEIEPQLILIRSGAFVGFLPEHFAKPWVEAGALRCLSPVAPSFDVGFDLVAKRGAAMSQAASVFAATLLKTFSAAALD
ncbi:MAG: LysR family transcriptional regulator [Flavimaricola sp.]|nr:LysR family transcriptional regulator [Flavimaricola sp.]